MGSDRTPGSIERAVARIREMSDRPHEQYDEFSSYSQEDRTSIYAQLDSGLRAQLWIEQTDRFKRDRPNLSEHQEQVWAQVWESVNNTSTFGGETTSGVQERHEQLKAAAVVAFGEEDARRLLAKLGT